VSLLLLVSNNFRPEFLLAAAFRSKFCTNTLPAVIAWVSVIGLTLFVLYVICVNLRDKWEYER
jgi:hypothetical protein